MLALVAAGAHSFLFALTDGAGTVPPESALVRGLVERGHRVVVIAEDSMEAEIRATGAVLRRWVRAPNRPSRHPDDDVLRDWEVRNPIRMVDRMLDTLLATPAEAYAADVEVAAAQEPPDAMVVNVFAPGAMVAAESLGIPFAVPHTGLYLFPGPGAEPWRAALRPGTGWVERAGGAVVREGMLRALDRGRDRLNTVRAARGLAPLGHFVEQFHRAAIELVLTSPAFDPASTRGYAGVRWVGPLLDDPAWSQSWTPRAGAEPLVLVGLSSSFQDQVGVLQRIVDALARLPVRAVVTTGPAIDPSRIVAAPNVEVVASAPHTQVLRHAAAMITHGGHGSVMKALAAEVPLLVVPHGRDQPDNARRVVQLGAGLRVRRSASSAAIAAAVGRLLHDPSFRRAAGEIGATLRRDAQANTAVAELEAMAARGPAHGVM